MEYFSEFFLGRSLLDKLLDWQSKANG